MIFVNKSKNSLLYFPKNTSYSPQNLSLTIWSEIDLVDHVYRSYYNMDDFVRTKGVSDVYENDILIFEAASTTKNYGLFVREADNQVAEMYRGELTGYFLWRIKNVDKSDDGRRIRCRIENFKTGSQFWGVYLYAKDDPWLSMAENEIFMDRVYTHFTTYDAQDLNPKGWDENSVAISAKDAISNCWSNDVSLTDRGRKNEVILEESRQSHNIQWNAYKLKNPNIFDFEEKADYYIINLDLSTYKAGEYRYLLKDDANNTIEESGIIYIKGADDAKHAPKNYIVKHEYKQYNG